MKSTLSPKELASAIGVSESSLRRWADDGKLEVTRTAGGHRRISLPEAIRFIRESGSPVVRPDVLGLGGESGLAGRTDDDVAPLLFDALTQGDVMRARSLVVGRFLAGESIASLADHLIGPAMSDVGELWSHEQAGIMTEHRATDICINIVSHLRVLLPAASGAAPVAIGGAPEADPYVIPSQLVAAVLSETGFRVNNFGAATPVAGLLQTAEQQHPALVWLSVTAPVDRGMTGTWRELGNRLAEVGADLVIGGRRAEPGVVPPLSNVHRIRTMTELAAFARGRLSAGHSEAVRSEAESEEAGDGGNGLGKAKARRSETTE